MNEKPKFGEIPTVRLAGSVIVGVLGLSIAGAYAFALFHPSSSVLRYLVHWSRSPVELVVLGIAFLIIGMRATINAWRRMRGSLV